MWRVTLPLFGRQSYPDRSKYSHAKLTDIDAKANPQFGKEELTAATSMTTVG